MAELAIERKEGQPPPHALLLSVCSVAVVCWGCLLEQGVAFSPPCRWLRFAVCNHSHCDIMLSLTSPDRCLCRCIGRGLSPPQGSHWSVCLSPSPSAGWPSTGSTPIPFSRRRPPRASTRGFQRLWEIVIIHVIISHLLFGSVRRQR